MWLGSECPPAAWAAAFCALASIHKNAASARTGLPAAASRVVGLDVMSGTPRNGFTDSNELVCLVRAGDRQFINSLLRSPEVAHDEPVRDEARDEHEGRKGKGRRVRPGSRHSISRDELAENPCEISKKVLVTVQASDIRRRAYAMQRSDIVYV